MLLLLFPLLAPADLLIDRRWLGYFTVIAGPGQDDRLAGLPSVHAVVAEGSSQVAINTFGGFLELSLAELKDLLDPSDPRYDSYLRALPAFFHPPGAEGSRTYFLRSDANPSLMAFWLTRLLGSGVGFLERDPLERLLCLLASLFGFAAILYGQVHEGRPGLAVLAALPWLLRVGGGDPMDLAAFLVLFPPSLAAAISLRRRMEQEGFAPPESFPVWLKALLLHFLAGSLILLLFSSRPLWRSMMELLENAAFTASAFLAVFLILQAGRLWQRLRIHPLFSPVSILAGTLFDSQAAMGPRARRPRVALLLSAAAFAAFGLLILEKSLSPWEAPSPISLPGRPRLTWGYLSRFSLDARNDGLPGLEEYIAHRAYQEGLLFNRPFRLPFPQERLTVSTYLYDPAGGRVVQTHKVVKQYPPSWLMETLARVPRPSVARMLLDQGGLKRADMEREASRFLRVIPWWRILLIVIFPAGSVLFLDRHLTPRLFYAMRDLLFLRRKHPVL